MAPKPSYLIVGAGVFGVGAAHELIKKYPDASVTLVDQDAYDAETRVAASWDWNKCVRADYDDLLYCKLAIEAQDVFNSDPLWKPYFHETGVYWICRSEYARNVIDNYRKLGRSADLSAVPIEEARKMFGGLFENADYDGAKEVLINKSSGWGAAGDSLRAITREALRLGVKYVTAGVTTLQFDNQGNCCGVLTETGEVINADHVILCTGAYTSKLLEFSAETSGISNLRAGSRIVAGGITTGMANLADLPADEYEKFAKMPVGFQGYPAEVGPFLGSLPPTADKEIKWWGPTIFRNTEPVLPGRYVSTPPDERDYAQWEVSRALQQDVNNAKKAFYGKTGDKWKMLKHRICWDAFTTNGDFIISKHPAAKGLYVATCGSFHGYKFFPVLGKYITQMLEDKLEPEMAERWAWDRERPDPALNPEWPRAELRDWLDPVTTARL